MFLALVILLSLSFLSIIAAGAAEGIMDKVNFHFFKSIFRDEKRFNQKFWNPELSWENKYKDPVTLEPKFFLSTTLLVAFTDAWHCFKSIRTSGIFLSNLLLTICTFIYSWLFMVSVGKFIFIATIIVLLHRALFTTTFALTKRFFTHWAMEDEVRKPEFKSYVKKQYKLQSKKVRVYSKLGVRKIKRKFSKK